MEKQEIKQEKMSADVLIIGGGIAGLTAAISVKEEIRTSVSGSRKTDIRIFRKSK